LRELQQDQSQRCIICIIYCILEYQRLLHDHDSWRFSIEFGEKSWNLGLLVWDIFSYPPSNKLPATTPLFLFDLFLGSEVVVVDIL